MIEKEKIKRIIFDLDRTLLFSSFFDKEEEFYKKTIPGIDEWFIKNMQKILDKYESIYAVYNYNLLLSHLNKYSNIELKMDFINIWEKEIKNSDVKIEEETIEILEYLKAKYELVILTNWFEETQIIRMKKAGLYNYFKEVHAGEKCMKPSIESYIKACSQYNPKECIMIGDNLLNDVEGALKAGLNAIHYTHGKEETHKYQKIKKLKELEKIL